MSMEWRHSASGTLPGQRLDIEDLVNAGKKAKTTTFNTQGRSRWYLYRKEFRNKTPLYRIDRPWIVNLHVLHGLGGVAS